MASNDYVFRTVWSVDGTCEEVSDVLSDARGLSRWWPSVYLTIDQTADGDAEGVGKRVEVHSRAILPYDLRWSFEVTEARRPHGFALVAQGDLTGDGRWTLTQRGPRCEVVYDWRVRADKPILAALSWLLKPVFSANHRWAMARGEESLRLELAQAAHQPKAALTHE
ncbi:MAG TPA: SRPBCC family protein, partial [Myxococcota bacterium]|nr:SRPBCC family protein [Myxococcota bacterium]